jgi:group I intron endonuclease
LKNIIGIYKITSPTGRVYIGKSKDINRRWKTYKNYNCKKQPKLYASLKKYGWEAHVFEIIEECDFDDLNYKERFWQDNFEVLNEGLNCVLTETEELDFVMTEETRKKMRDSMLGDKNPMFNKTGELNSFFGKTHSEEQKRIWSEARKGKNTGKDSPLFGKPHTEEQRKAQSLRMKGKYVGEKSPMWGKKKV